MGGANVTSYNLQWDNATQGATWFNIIGFSPLSLELITTITSFVQSGKSYQFRVRASNVYGWSTTWSDITTIKAA